MMHARKLLPGACAAVAALALAAGVASAETMTYTYDVFGQLKSAVSSAGPAVSYNYDDAGNRTLLRMGADVGPVANADSVAMLLNQVATFDPRTNDTDTDSDTLGITGATNGAHGTVSWIEGSLTYTPATDYVGSDSFNYTIADGRGQSATGSVSVSVTVPPMTASVSRTSYFGHKLSNGTWTTVSPVNVTANGGWGGYTYSWARTSGDSSTTISSSTSSSVQWTRPGYTNGGSWISYWACTVKDSHNTTVTTATVKVTIQNGTLI